LVLLMSNMLGCSSVAINYIIHISCRAAVSVLIFGALLSGSCVGFYIYIAWIVTCEQIFLINKGIERRCDL